jgi:AraC family transcriptional regulator, regulatory protein of adaptative response / methylated-DNA-[protein]-cysteine methyltransferase
MNTYSTFEREITVTMKETVTAHNDIVSNDIFWNAVCTKDRGFDGTVWFAVKTTGVYCRPSCSSRQPLRGNVQFFPSPEAAQYHGFRACKRCKPDQLVFSNPAMELVQRICVFLADSMTENPDETVHLETLGAKFGLSNEHLQRTFTSALGISPKDYADALRINRFKSLVQSGETVTAAMYDAGYGSSSRLYEKSDALLGMTPASYKRGGKGATIYSAVQECRLGYVLVAATERGLCSVELGQDPKLLQARMQNEFAHATFSDEQPAEFRAWLTVILTYIETMMPQSATTLLSLPLDVITTVFQARVWSCLRAIPHGETRSYAGVAESLGQPTASRAVASACASNPLALVTPCHRVVRQDGDLSGYRWGVERKRQILDWETSAHAAMQD